MSPLRLVRAAARRLDPLPQLPFAVALVVAVVVLAAAVEFRPEPDPTVEDVAEVPSRRDAPPPVRDFEEEDAVELELLEYGFGRVLDEYGHSRVIFGAVVRNPYERAMVAPGSVTVRAPREEGGFVELESFYPNPIPAETTLELGFALTAVVEAPLSELDAVVAEPSYLAPYPEELPEEDRYWTTLPPLPRIEVVSVEPLLSPEGFRVHYRVVCEQEQSVRLVVIFRDSQGRIVGGLPAGEEPFSFDLGAAGWRTVPEGESSQVLDLEAPWIPEEADLDRIEIGPRTSGGG